MALDVYVGGFARYFAREWENVGQKWARETGTEYHLITPSGDPPEAADWDEVAEAVQEWCKAMNSGLGARLAEPLGWNEGRDMPYFTDRPGYDGYGALVVWAAHAELGTQPPGVLRGAWYDDEALTEVGNSPKDRSYTPIVLPNLWLPGTFQFGFEAPGLTGEKSFITSNRALLGALDKLNESTFGLDDRQLADRLEQGGGESPTTRQLAAFGLAAFKQLCGKSVEHHLPMLLDM